MINPRTQRSPQIPPLLAIVLSKMEHQGLTITLSDVQDRHFALTFTRPDGATFAAHGEYSATGVVIQAPEDDSAVLGGRVLAHLKADRLDIDAALLQEWSQRPVSTQRLSLTQTPGEWVFVWNTGPNVHLHVFRDDDAGGCRTTMTPTAAAHLGLLN